MNDVKELEARLNAALTALEDALARPAPAQQEDAGAVAALEAENADLTARLDSLTEEREKDLAQLDTLIAQLRPLVEEAV